MIRLLLPAQESAGDTAGQGAHPGAACTQLRGWKQGRQPAVSQTSHLLIPRRINLPDVLQTISLEDRFSPDVHRAARPSVVNGYKQGCDFALGAVCSCLRAVSCRHRASGTALLVPFHPAAPHGVMPGSSLSWGAAAGDPGWAEGHSHLLSSLVLFTLSSSLAVSSDLGFSQIEVFLLFGKAKRSNPFGMQPAVLVWCSPARSQIAD